MIPVWWSVTLTVLGGLGWLLVTVERRVYGFVVGLLAQVAWVAYAVTTAQWGFIGSASLFGAINALGLYRWSRARRQPAAAQVRVHRLWRDANPGCTCRWSPLHGHERHCPAWSPPSPGLTGLLNPADKYLEEHLMTLTPGDLPTTAIVNNAAAVALPARVRESLTAQANMAAGQAKLDRNNEARYQEQANAHRASAESLEAQAAEIRDYLAHHPDTAPDPEPAPAHTGGSSGASFVQ